MDMLRETAPFLVGMIMPLIFMLLINANWSSQGKFLATFLLSLIMGICTSALAGELTAGMPDGLIAIIIDTSLVYTGSQLAYRLFWKPVLEERIRRSGLPRTKRALR